MAAARANLESTFCTAWPADQWRDVHVVLGVSGGADSVAMLRLASAAKLRAGGTGRMYVAHLNHRLRGLEADQDATWLAELCREFELPCEIGCADVAALAGRQGDGLEAAARSARYDFFRETAQRLGARFVAVAHTADDQIETVLQRLLRGTGVAGLAGMPPVRPLSPAVQLVRPMLGARRREVLQYLTEIGQDFRTDSSNADRRLTRNRLRGELLPFVRREFNAEVDEAILRLAQQARGTQQLVANLAEKLVERAIIVSPEQLRIDCRCLANEAPLLVREACKAAWTAAGWPLQDMGFSEWQQLQSLISSDALAGSRNLPGGFRAERRADQALISKST